MKTLIIHPEDPSTQFLEVVYQPIKNKTVITGGVTKYELKKIIFEHDRVMMMGHGSPRGLFSVGQFAQQGGYIIDDICVPELKRSEDNVYIWCNADRFVEAYDLKGFYSGMFISEVGEATYCGLPGMSQEIVDESNFGFCEILAKYINDDSANILRKVKKEYGLIAENNPVAFYNHKRLYGPVKEII